MGKIFNKDFVEFIQRLNDNGVDYILVGGYSVILHGYPRTTGDLDIWVDCNVENYKRIERAFGEFGLALFDMTLKNFLNTDELDVFRFGRPPMAIDIITSLKGIGFKKSQKNAVEQEFDGVKIKYLSFTDLISAKKSAGRAKDINDIENLENNI